MIDIKYVANEMMKYLCTIDGVKSAKLCGSVANDSFDKYSDIDIEIDVSGSDNSVFMTKIIDIMNKEYPVVYYDYAPSLFPQKYIVSLAISNENPFMIVDINCIASPHYSTIKKNDISLDKFTHTLKVFVANLKHYKRGQDCYQDIIRMYNRIYGESQTKLGEEDMLRKVFFWLDIQKNEKFTTYLNSLEKYINL